MGRAVTTIADREGTAAGADAAPLTGARRAGEARTPVMGGPNKDWLEAPWLSSAAWLSLAYCTSSYGLAKLRHLVPPEVADACARWQLHVQAVPLLLVLAAVCYAALRLLRNRRRTLLLDFAAFKPGDELKAPQKGFIEGSAEFGRFSKEALDFQEKIMLRNGLSDETYLPPCMHLSPPRVNMQFARDEAHMVLTGCVQEVLDRTGLRPRDIDILVLNCSLFNPTPSLTAMLVNHFHMRSDVLTYNLAGMGCSAGVISIGLAQRLLRTQPNSYALVVSTENITQNWYQGSDRSMLIPNTLFRVGGAAMVLTNRAGEARRAKYELEHIVRIHLGSDDVAYRCVFQHEDSEGVLGVELNKDLVKVAGKALERNLTKLGPLVLPLEEKLRFALRHVQRMMLGRAGRPAYVPDFKKAFAHFCLHAGGRGVIEGLGKQLGLTAAQVEPSFNSLYWYGNTSSASIWYALSYIEACQSVRRGQRVWQVAFGSGFKCNSAVWRALRSFRDDRHEAWAHLQGEQPQAAQRRGAWWRYLQEKGSPGAYGREHEAPVRRDAPASPTEAPAAVAAAPKGPVDPAPPPNGKRPSPGVSALNGLRMPQPQSVECH